MKKNSTYIDDFRVTLQNRIPNFTEEVIYGPESNRHEVCFKLAVPRENLPDHNYCVYVSEYGKVTIQTVLAYDVAKAKTAVILQLLNEINSKNCFVKFFLDEDRDVLGEYETMVANSEENGQHIFQTLGFCAIVVDSVIPRILSLQWGESDSTAGDSDLLQTILNAISEKKVGDAND